MDYVVGYKKKKNTETDEAIWNDRRNEWGRNRLDCLYYEMMNKNISMSGWQHILCVTTPCYESCQRFSDRPDSNCK
jgi:hypothetical protein